MLTLTNGHFFAIVSNTKTKGTPSKEKEMIVKTLVHTKDATDEDLAKEATRHFEQSTALQFQAEIFPEVRPWLSSEEFHRLFPTLDIMKCLVDRPDLRQVMATNLVGTKLNRARVQNPEKQAKDIDETLESKDITLLDIENAITPQTLAIYVFGNRFWTAFAEEILAKIVEANGKKEKEFISLFLERALAKRGFGGKDLTPALTYDAVADSFDVLDWQKRIPDEKLATVIKARRAQARKNPRINFTCEQEIGIVGIDTIVNSFDLTDFVPMVKAAGEALGFGDEELFTDLSAQGAKPTAESPKG